MDVKISDAISEQNRAFVLRLNERLGKPIPETLIRKQLEANEPLQVARLVLRTHEELNKPESSGEAVKVTKFHRFIMWIKTVTNTG